MLAARMRPSACLKSTVSTSRTAVTRAAMIATASSTDIIGPPKAKQSSLNCAMASQLPLSAARKHVRNVDRRSLHHSGDGRDVIEMDNRQPRFKLGIACNAHDPGVIWE